MRERANQEEFKLWPVLVLAAMAALFGCLLGPAIDAELAVGDARIEAHRASLVSQQ